MSDGREQVLTQIRRSLRGGEAMTALVGTGPLPEFSGDLVQRFAAKMLEKSATLERIDSLAEAGAAVARFVAQIHASPRLCVAPVLAELAWSPDLHVHHGAAGPGDETCVTPCFAAVAESGSVVTLSGPSTPSTLNFVPDNHIVIVYGTQVVRRLEDVWAGWRASHQPMPRTVNIISGPSRTADIEQTIQLGAHGPRRLHIVLIAA